jgi:hypothetical protein
MPAQRQHAEGTGLRYGAAIDATFARTSWSLWRRNVRGGGLALRSPR